MKLHGLQFVDISQDLECGAPDAFVESATDTSVIGVQVTRSSSGIEREGSNKFKVTRGRWSNCVMTLFSRIFLHGAASADAGTQCECFSSQCQYITLASPFGAGLHDPPTPLQIADANALSTKCGSGTPILCAENLRS